MHHYFVENEDIASIDNDVFTIKFADADKNHIKAQRLKVGEHITVVDASANYFELEIVEVKDCDLSATISLKKDYPASNFHITLYQGVSKNTKLEDVLRATTEIGISQFSAVNMERSVAVIKKGAEAKKLERFNSVARSAAMQSGRRNIPEVKILSNFDALLNDLKILDSLLVFWEKAEAEDTIEKALNNLANVRKVGILIGPEGGISEGEIQQLREIDNCRICTLGNTILRTETAGIASTAIVKHILDGA